MQSSQGAAECRVSDDGLRVEGGWCESLAGKLAGNSAPVETASAWPSSAAAISASRAEVAAANIRCTFRVQATANKLPAAANAYTQNEYSSAAQLGALDTARAG